ncbi:PREDICTED: C-type lectin domain family 10 member A-like isoform X2 [Poecilia mexicana]|uniref:C-type lectin domain family 10 member A-like isoform X2 n=1 Tax=Poecilia mexicana TaxID=48701 RepID=UPI00072E38ED|nr:PREDICTED: C-type lectin domain family 10 member A-like isoform X2 [Poecilia mexicana]
MNRKAQSLDEEIEEADYVNEIAGAEEKMRAAPGHTFSSISQLFQLAAYWMILLVVIPLHIHLHISVDFELNQLKTKEAALMEKIQNLTKELDQVKTEKKNLTEQIENMKKPWNEQSVSRAQWIIDQYCPKDKNRRCVSCQKGWTHSQSSCYAVNDAELKDQKTWEEAQEDCRGKSSDLTVVGNEEEKTFLKDKSWVNKNINGYWIGLRAVEGIWKWIDGSDLTNQ